MAGWIKLHRSMKNHWLWEGEQFTKGQAWIDLLLWARHTPGNTGMKSGAIYLQVGQQARSEVTLSKTWGWSRDKVRRFLKRLENDGMIIQQKTRQTSIITICNYSEYQQGKTTNDTTDDTTNKHQTNNQQDTIEEGNKGNKGKKDLVPSTDSTTKTTNEYSDEFETAWAMYPKRKGGNPKIAAYKAWKARLRAGEKAEVMTEGVQRYAEFCKHEGKIGSEYVKQASAFFGPDKHYAEPWETSGCPHSDILKLWKEIMPSHIIKPDHDDWLPNSQAYQNLDLAWYQFMTMPRATTGKPVFTEKEGGLKFYRAVFEKLANTERALKEDAGQFVTIGWAVKKDNTVSIFKGEVQ